MLHCWNGMFKLMYNVCFHLLMHVQQNGNLDPSKERLKVLSCFFNFQMMDPTMLCEMFKVFWIILQVNSTLNY